MEDLTRSSVWEVGRRMMLRSQSQLSKEEEEEDEEEEEEEGAVPQSMQQRKGHKLWHVLQKGFRRPVERMKNEELQVAYSSHGLQHLCRVPLNSPVRYVTHHTLKRLFVVLDAENMLHFVREDGTYQSCRPAPGPMAGLLYATQVDQFVAWAEDSLQVLDSALQPLSQVQAALPIKCGLYSELLNRIVTAGDGNLTVWDFRYGFRSLQCRFAVSEGLAPDDVFNRLTLDTSETSPQRCFASCGTGVAAFDISNGRLLSFQKELHSRVITDLAYCEVVGCVVTASRDTTIKVWDEHWHVQNVFVGHTAPVIAVTIYPQRSLIFSASQDGTIRTWNLETIDQVDQVHISEPVEALETKTDSHVVSISGLSLNLWKINQLYSLYLPLGSPVLRLRSINLEAVGDFPIRILCLCHNSTTRLLDVRSGRILSVLTLAKPLQAVDVAYCLPRETLFVLLDDGTLLRANAAIDPMLVKKSSQSEGRASRGCCLLLYTHMVDPATAHATWLEVVESKGDKKPWQKLPPKLQSKNRYQLIMGHQNGLLSAVDWFSGRIQYQVDAHSSQQVTALAEYPTQTCVISAGADLTVKMWRLFPYTTECLVPLLCFSCATPALHMCSLGATLAVAFQDPESATYSIVFYNLMDQSRSEHGPDDDPLDDITGLCCCPSLKLFASASKDGSVKVWDNGNRLLRHLKLNTIPESLAFANHQGDLLVAIERHLYLIHHNKYLPSHYRMKLLCEKFLEPIKDVPLPFSEASFEALVKDNVRRLMYEPSLEETESSKPGDRRMALQQSRVLRGNRVRMEGFARLAVQNHDLEQLQRGEVTAVKKCRFTKEMREEAFEKYLQIFYKEPLTVEIPAEDTFDADEVLEALQRVGSLSELYGPDGMFLGSFPKPSILKAPTWMLVDTRSPTQTSLATEKSLPAPSAAPVTPPSRIQEMSTSYSLVGKVKSEQVGAPEAPSMEKMLLESPPKQTEELPEPPQRASPETHEAAVSPDGDKVWKRSPVLKSPPRTRARREMACLDVIQESGATLSSRLQISLTPSLLVDFIQGDKGVHFEESSRASKESVRSQESHSRSQARSWEQLQRPQQMDSKGLLLPRITSGFMPNSVVTQQAHSQELLSVEMPLRVAEPQEEPESPSRVSSKKRVGRDEPLGGEASGVRASSSSQSRIRRSPPPEVFLTQLDESQYQDREIPFFVSPFRKMEWFKKLFPEGFLPGMSLNAFLTKLLEAFLAVDYSMKMELLGAIVSLQEELWGEMNDMVHDTLIHALNQETDSPSIQDRTQKRFIVATLRGLLRFNKDSKDLMVELMAYYLKAPVTTRGTIKTLMKEIGVQDPHNYFCQEMDSWQVAADDPKEAVREACGWWLEGMLQTLQEHRRSIWEQDFQPGRKSSLERHQKDQRDEAGSQGGQPQRTSSLDSYQEGQEQRRDLGDDGEQSERRESFASHQDKSAEHWMDFQSLRPIDAINYFIEKQLERELEAMKQLTFRAVETPKDSVLVLPPVQKTRAILRLGETNAMLRKRLPEHIGFCFPYIFPRYVMKGFAPFVKLPLPKINLDPFPSQREKPALSKTFTAMQQTVQKYFIPKFSYADSYV